ncbi:translocation/assembly module TamB domain-containing protein [Solimicrobium silvestre]|uniref:Translocation and assembly module TamB C-terminal domain-containing protein n=1 Tax=Solimicrobium silvestre TaxID=2099400 RepID=A0A2S9H5L2_9BURK|nr:translocation/assembly module TamB domain-containing protein [Solimicrobium silvestre]PRC95275.1 Family of unknown function (DUF490) [Solimicrobium silvestre]
MTDPTNTANHINAAAATPKQNKKSVARRIFNMLFLSALLFIALLILAAAWLVATEAGAKTTLALLDRYASIHSQGVSGSLLHQLKIQHIELRNKELDLVVDDVALQWQPSALWRQQLQLDYLRINSLQLALAPTPSDDKPAILPASLSLPRLIKLVKADQLAINNFQLSTLDASGKHGGVQQFSALTAQVVINSENYQLQFSGTTPWGNAALSGNLGSAAPFNLQAKFDWQGLAIQQSGVTVPVTQLHGTLSGNLKKLLLQAQLDVAEIEKNAAPNFKPASGQIHAVLTPFSVLPLDTLQLDLNSVNPASFYADAPKANLHLKADFKAVGDVKAPILRGHFAIKNTMPMIWNAGGIPVAAISSDITLDEHQISWQATQIELEAGGSVLGSGHLNLHKTALPDLFAQLDLKNVDLLHIDKRLKKTQLSGQVRVENITTGLQFALNLHESQPNLSANLKANVHLSNEQLLSVQKLELLAKDATLNAQGSFALQGRQEFLLQGEAHNLNPARWIDVPEGHIATRFKVAGQVQQGWRIDAQLAELSGQFAGLALQGESNLIAQQGKLLSIKKLELNWGKSHLSASGNWQLNESANANQHEQLQLALAVPDLAALSRPFEKIVPISLKGSLFVDGILSGNSKQPSGRLNVKADKLAIPELITLEKLQANIELAEGITGKIDGNLELTGLAAGKSETENFKIERIQASLSGLRHAHQLHVSANLPQQHQIELQAQGDLQEASAGTDNVTQWQGQIQKLNLAGELDFQLAAPFALKISSKAAQMGAANWQGKLGQLQVQQVNWSRGQLSTQGKLQGLQVVNALKLWHADIPLAGKLQIDAAWQLDIGQQIAGQFEIKRTSGDLSVKDMASGYNQTLALGLQNLFLKASTGDGGGSARQQAINVQLQAQGAQLGQIEANLRSAVNKTEQGWALAANAPLSGTASIQIQNIQWVSQLLGSGIALRGELQAQGQLSGTLDKPDYSAQINGKDLQISLTELGVLLPNGSLKASMDKTQFTLSSLKFSQTIKAPPRHDKLTEFTWLNETGFVESSGTVDLQSGRGSITTRWQHFPFLQNADSWLVATGDAQLTESGKTWNLTGQLLADGAYFSVPKQAPPKLSSDVVVLKKNAKKSVEKSDGLQSSVDFSIKTGKNFVFVGRGLDTSLDGDLRIRIKNGGSILATGSIQTTGGTYEGYGQQLAIERGILNFQGAPDNPGLNVRAIRRGLPVEAGVEVIGTVAKPEVRLISEPNVPDPDKLSWMVLGRSSDQMAGSEAALLMSAAGAIFGGDSGSGSNMPRDIAHSLGLDDLSVGTTSTAPGSQLPSQTVAGNISATSPNEQAFSVGKRITPNLVFSIERSLTDATNGLKLTWQLTRRFSVIGRAGSDTAIDGQYTFSFD